MNWRKAWCRPVSVEGGAADGLEPRGGGKGADARRTGGEGEEC